MHRATEFNSVLYHSFAHLVRYRLRWYRLGISYLFFSFLMDDLAFAKRYVILAVQINKTVKRQIRCLSLSTDHFVEHSNSTFTYRFHSLKLQVTLSVLLQVQGQRWTFSLCRLLKRHTLRQKSKVVAYFLTCLLFDLVKAIKHLCSLKWALKGQREHTANILTETALTSFNIVNHGRYLYHINFVNIECLDVFGALLAVIYLLVCQLLPLC